MTRALLLLAGLTMANGCATGTEESARPSEAAPARDLATAGTAGLHCSSEWLNEGDQVAGIRMTGLYAQRAGRCPTRTEVEEILHIWKQNEGFWTEFPAQEGLFFDSNVKEGEHGVMPELVGLSFEDAKKALTEDPGFPMSQDRGPMVVDDMTLYEFSGGMSVYLVVVRDARVASIYFFDQV